MQKRPPKKTQSPTVADIAKRVDGLIATYEVPVKAVVDSVTPEGGYVAAMFDCSDSDGMQIYRELGFTEDSKQTSIVVMDILHAALVNVLKQHKYQPLDEYGYEAGTILLYVFTMRVAVVRRFAAGGGPKLKELRRARDVEFVGPYGLMGRAALEIIVQRCASALKLLRDRSEDRVAFLSQVPHGANVSMVTRAAATSWLRAMRDGTPDDDQRYAREVADTLAAGQGEGDIDCLINGWGPIQHVRVQARSLDDAPRFYGDPDEALLLGHIAACRDRKRALGFLKKSLEKLQTSPVTPLLVELVRLVREDWENCDAILATATEATNVSASENVPDEGFRLRATLVAILQATTERQMGGPINGPSGHA